MAYDCGSSTWRIDVPAPPTERPEICYERIGRGRVTAIQTRRFVEWSVVGSRSCAGHGGASGRYDALRDRAFELAWMLKQVGITK